MTTKVDSLGATEEIKLGQNEANSEDSSVLLQESMEKILRQIVNSIYMIVDLLFHPQQALI